MKHTIRLRDDDVLLPSSSWDKPLHRFKRVHRWIMSNEAFIHVPAILVTEIQQYPEAVDFIKQETEAGNMVPQIHGFEHIDYGNLSTEQVSDDLDKCMHWFWFVGLPRPTIFYTPWGANSVPIQRAAKNHGLKVVDCSDINKLDGRYGMMQRLLDGEHPSFMEGLELFYHWWSSGSRLLRIIKIHKYGSIEAAKEADPELFS